MKKVAYDCRFDLLQMLAWFWRKGGWFPHSFGGAWPFLNFERIITFPICQRNPMSSANHQPPAVSHYYYVHTTRTY